MKEAFCYRCGKPGAWPLCKGCRAELQPAPEPVVEKGIHPNKHPCRRDDYFEAVLQIRTRSDEPRKVVWDIIESLQEKREFKAWIKEGETDIHFSAIKSATDVSKALERQFDLDVIRTRKEVGFDRMRTKKQFKWTICVRDRD